LHEGTARPISGRFLERELNMRGLMMCLMLAGCGVGVEAQDELSGGEGDALTAARVPIATFHPLSGPCATTACPAGSVCRATLTGARCVAPTVATGPVCNLFCTPNSVCVLTTTGPECRPLTPACQPTAASNACACLGTTTHPCVLTATNQCVCN
jgi:hypothetical protein